MDENQYKDVEKELTILIAERILEQGDIKKAIRDLMSINPVKAARRLVNEVQSVACRA